MSDFVTLTCPSCGGKLQITNDIDRFACGHCGNEHVVKRGGGIVALSPVVEGLAKVQAGTDKTASELAIVRLTQEIASLEVKRQELRSESDNRMGGGCLLFLIPAALIFLANDKSVAMVWLVPLAVIVGGWFVMQKSSEGDRRLLAAIDQEIATREDELEHHRGIVSTKR
jgi:hypothetical protein